MCGRYALYGPASRLREHFSVADWPDFGDRYNIAPSLECPVIRLSPQGERLAHLLRWGLVPHWAKDASIGARLNNARAESVASKPSFRAAYRRRRCLIPASGYYEWQAVAGARKQPWFIGLVDDEPLAMGGLWESWRDPAGELLRSFCVVTTAPNALMQPIHDRMPVIVARADWESWLSPINEDPADLLAPFPAERMRAWKVSRRVSSAREEGPALIAQVDAAEPPN